MASAMRLTQHRLRLVAELLEEGGAVASVAVVSLVAMEVRQDPHKALRVNDNRHLLYLLGGLRHKAKRLTSLP